MPHAHSAHDSTSNHSSSYFPRGSSRQQHQQQQQQQQQQHTNYAAPMVRDSLELASLASSSGPTASNRNSLSSSPSGISSSRKLSLDEEDPLGDPNAAAGHGSSRPIHHRNYSVSSAFDFTPNLYPLSSTALGGYAPVGVPSSATLPPTGSFGTASLERQKTLTYVNGLSLLAGLIVGSGIFSSPSQVNSRAGSPGASLIVWAVAGMLVWTGAASYAELGSAMPLNGGAQVYLSKIFGEFAGFLFTWCAVWVLKPGSAAIIAIIFGEYMVRAVVGADAVDASAWANKAVALAGMLVVLLINCLSTKLATRVGDLFTIFKFVALLGVTITGVVVAATGFSWKGPANQDWKTKGWFDNTSTSASAWAVALYAGLWAFDGWDNVNYVAGEFRNPNRDIPRAIHTSMPLVTLFYLMANVAYFFVLPFETIKSSNTVAVQFGAKVFGPVGSAVLAIVVSASCFGALNATTFTSGRLVYAASKEGYLPSVFGRIGFGVRGNEGAQQQRQQQQQQQRRQQYRHSNSSSRLHTRSWARKQLSRLLGDDDDNDDGGGGGEMGGIWFTPINAMLLNAVLTTAYILVGEFGTLLTFYGVAGYSFYFVTVLGVIVLRVREPGLDRPYKTWISTPIIFCCVSLFLLSRAVFAEPVQTLVVLAFMLAGAIVYFWKVRCSSSRSLSSSSRSLFLPQPFSTSSSTQPGTGTGTGTTAAAAAAAAASVFALKRSSKRKSRLPLPNTLPVVADGNEDDNVDGYDDNDDDHDDVDDDIPDGDAAAAAANDRLVGRGKYVDGPSWRFWKRWGRSR